VLPINFLSEGAIYNWLSEINDDILFSTIKRMLEAFDIKDYIFINVFNPFYAQKFPAFFKPKLFIYYSVDNIGHCAFVDRHGPRLEDMAVSRASFILATSRDLANNVKRKSDVHYLPNAADISLFLSDDYNGPPEEFMNIRTPIIIYVGHIDQRIDFDLIRSILKSHPDKTLVMLGPHSIGEELYRELSQFQNIKFLGRRDLVRLPHYLHYSHCCIIPFKCNEQTRSIYPLKINEYLATGRPVVSTPFSEDIGMFSELIYIADSHEEFNRKISMAIGEDTEALHTMRTKAVLENNWENRAIEFWNIANRYLIEETVAS
jgi:teichuronic acid biosynthesis glycosyltransferase TuaH